MSLESKDTVFYSKKTLNLRGNVIDLSYPIVMGILNVTPDSFYDGGLHNDGMRMLEKVGHMLTDGAFIIDVGGYSSRPGALDVSEAEEMKRVIPAIKNIMKEYPDAYVSVDTFRSSVAEAAIDEGAVMVNDISAGSLDEKMFETIGKLKVPYVLMHMRGNPQNMRDQTDYDNILMEVIDFFQKKIEELRAYQVKDIIVDPGFGFAKTIEQNYNLLKHLNYFRLLNLPVLAGMSRKSMIYKKLNTTSENALNGTTTLNAIALMNRVNILRVHDVNEAIETITLFKTTYN
ncbi:MAG TPA: dihydropteroate synthase [Cytophagaceae bacterium]|jgi:dihydropteroate synthase|nr:dihydropteroate synthase [Cytophagaceae bacterium]